MNWDHTARIIELILISGAVGFLWRGVRKLDRFTVHLEEYPLHRHVGGDHYLTADNIIYPKGQAPEEPKRVGVGA